MSRPLLFNVTDAAVFLGFSRWTVNKMCKKFEIAWIPRGKKGRWIALKDLEAWIEKNTVHSQEELKKALDGRGKHGTNDPHILQTRRAKL